MKLRTLSCLIAFGSLACVDETTIRPEPRDDTDARGVIQRGSVEEQRAASGGSGLRGAANAVLTGRTLTLSESAITSTADARTSSASYLMVSSVRLGVQ